MTDTRKIALPESPDEAETTDLLFRELDKIKVEDGVEYDPLSLNARRWQEATQNSPSTLYDENVPWRFWKLVASHIKAMCRRTASPELLKSREVALAYARHLVRSRVNAMTPFRTQKDLFDLLMLSIPEGTPEDEAMSWCRSGFEDVLRCWREAVDRCFQSEYLGRKVG